MKNKIKAGDVVEVKNKFSHITELRRVLGVFKVESTLYTLDEDDKYLLELESKENGVLSSDYTYSSNVVSHYTKVDCHLNLNEGLCES